MNYFSNMLKTLCLFSVFLSNVVSFDDNNNELTGGYKVLHESSQIPIENQDHTKQVKDDDGEYQKILEDLLGRYGDLKLPRLEAVQIGHQTQFEHPDGKNRSMKAVSITPPIFEIDDFLNDSECEHLMKLAEENGLEISRVLSEDEETDVEFMRSEIMKNFKTWDKNSDGIVEMKEAQIVIESYLDFVFDESNITEMLQMFEMDSNKDGLISPSEFSEYDFDEMAAPLVRYVRKIKSEKPETKTRHSQQAFINPSNDYDFFNELQKRLAKLTRLPDELIQASEDLQVVRYGSGGHYNCHSDSEEIRRESPFCCHLQRASSELQHCMICRYVTVLYFLNDVPEGGETAFPIAGSTSNVDTSGKDGVCNLARNCLKSNVVVKPKKGKAVLWYNHHRRVKSGWLGQLDFRSDHGGCEVIKGPKWIANNWINVSPFREHDIENWAILKAHKLRQDAQHSPSFDESNTNQKTSVDDFNEKNNEHHYDQSQDISKTDHDEL